MRVECGKRDGLHAGPRGIPRDGNRQVPWHEAKRRVETDVVHRARHVSRRDRAPALLQHSHAGVHDGFPIPWP